MSDPIPHIFDGTFGRIPGEKLVPRFKHIFENRRSYRRMVLDDDCSMYLETHYGPLLELIDKQKEFAKPPFEKMAIQFRMFGSNREDIREGLAVFSEDGIMDGLWSDDQGELRLLPFSMRIEYGQQLINNFKGEQFEPKEMESYKFLTASVMVKMQLLFLLMHKPKALQITHRPRKVAIVKGKRKVFMESHVVNIDLLAAADEVTRTAITGARGPYRAHECRGTWVNYDRNRECDHEWQEVPSEDGIPRYFCIKCSQRRSWRKAHVRGDATLGWVRKQYMVTAKGVDQ